MSGAKYDWERLKGLYITGKMSYKELAQQENVNQKVLERRGREEKWVQARMKYRRKTVEKAVGKAQKGEVNRLSSLMQCAENLSTQLERALADPEAFYKYVVSVGDWNTECKKFDRPDMRAIRDAAAALKEAVAITRDLYDLPTQEARHAQSIAASRLAVEERKAKLAEEQAKAKTDGDISIGLAPEVEAYGD